MDYPDPQNMLQLLYGPYNAPGINSASFQNADYDKHYEQLAALDYAPAKKRANKAKLIARMLEIVDAETPWITVDFRRNISLRHSRLLEPPPDVFRHNSAKYMTLASK
jgi:ABC-type transport system substrate-binding protein